MGPGPGGESGVGEFDSESDPRSTDNGVKLARRSRGVTSGLGFSKQKRYCWGYRLQNVVVSALIAELKEQPHTQSK